MDYIEIQEKIDPSVRYALIEQFPNTVTALLEITDNSIAGSLPNKPMEIRITKQKGISITDKGGKSMDLKALEKFLTWGLGDRKSIFRFHGQGGKAALAFLANNFTLYSTPKAANVTYSTEVRDWPQNLDQLRNIRFEIHKPALFSFPTTSFHLAGLRKPIAPADIKRRLAETYRPLLVKDMVRIWVNGSKVAPVEIPYKERTVFSETTPFGPVGGWVGLKPEGSAVRGGIRCYTQGRLISKREFFDLDDPAIDLEHIVGEVELPFVPVTTLKMAFAQGSKEWLAVCEVLRPKLKPFARRVFYIQKLPESLGKIMPRLKKEVPEIFRLAGETFGPGGRNPPSEGKKEGKERPHKARRRGRPASPRPSGAVGTTPRQGPFDVRPMDENIRSFYDKKEGIILINQSFPAFVTSMALYRHNPTAFIGYVVETIALEWYTQDGTPPSEIKERVNHIVKVAYER